MIESNTGKGKEQHQQQQCHGNIDMNDAGEMER
jgi:hypothetical protein